MEPKDEKMLAFRYRMEISLLCSVNSAGLLYSSFLVPTSFCFFYLYDEA